MNTIDSYNQTHFGMRYKSPKKWGQKTLQTFMDSKLKKDIDEKYPEAIASYNITKKKVSTIFERPEYCYNLDFRLQLEKGKVWTHQNSAINSEEYLDDAFSKKIKQTSIFDVELDIEQAIREKTEHQEYIKKAEEENKKNKKSFLNIFNFLRN